MKIEQVDINKLKPAEYNPRIITDEEFKGLVNSIKIFGFIDPIIVNKDYTIIGGHQRYQVALKLGIKEVPCNILDLDKKQEKKLNVVLNSHAISGKYDELKLAELLEEMKLDNDYMELRLNELEPLDLSEDVEAQEDDFEAPKEAKYKIEVGDIFQLGDHRLMCGDSTSIEAVEKLMDGNKADMVFTDPPYNTGMTGETQGSDTLWKGNHKKRKGEKLGHMFNDKYSDDEWEDFMSLFTSNYFMVMKDDSVAYICLDWRRSYELIPHIKDHFHLSNVIVWDKMVHGLGSDYKYTYELIHVCKKGKPKLNTHQGEQEYKDVWSIQRKMGRDEEHATKKPLELCSRAIRHASKVKEIVLDLFGGSGSTLIACEELKRKCYMMELDPYYCSVIIERWEKLTQKEHIKL